MSIRLASSFIFPSASRNHFFERAFPVDLSTTSRIFSQVQQQRLLHLASRSNADYKRFQHVANKFAYPIINVKKEVLGPTIRRFFHQASKDQFKTIYSDKDLFSLGGYEEIIDRLADLVRYLQNPNDFTKVGAKPPKGVILSGPPGVGKTMLAEAIAGHAGVPLLLISAPEIERKFVGESEENLRRLFKYAEEIAPCVICIDEIESMAGKRIEVDKISAERQSISRYANSVVNQLLSLLSQDRPGVIVIGTTNHFDSLDPAVVRPGRFDRHIHITLPNRKDRKNILQLLTKEKKLQSDVSLDVLAAISTEFSGAKLAGWVNEAAVCALREKYVKIGLRHFDAARTIMSIGVTRPSSQNHAQKFRTAAHEAGHALIGHLLGQQIYKISIFHHGISQGYTEFTPPGDDLATTKHDLLNIICISLSGRAAELILGTPAAGCKDDFDKAKSIALEMVQDEGMGSTISGLSKIEVEDILKQQMTRAVNLLKENEKAWVRVRDALIEHEELLENDFLKAIVGRQITGNKKARQLDHMKQLPLPPKKPFKQNEHKNVQSDSFVDKLSEIGKNLDKLEMRLGINPSSPKKSNLPYTLEEVAKSLGVDSSSIRRIENGISKQVWISFDTSFNRDMKPILEKLLKYDIEHVFLDLTKTLLILSAGCGDFYAFVKKNGSK